MSLVRCQSKLREQIAKDASGCASISKCMSKARGADKTQCVKDFGGVAKIKTFINANKKDTQKNTLGSAPIKASSRTNTRQTTTTTPGSSNQVRENIKDTGQKLVRIFVGIILLIVLWRFFKYIFEFTYDVINAKRLIFMKIWQTRGDTKTDREVEKELAKDMKEKISRMAQVFNNLHKIGNLGFMDSVWSFLFRKPKILALYHYENGQLHFIMATYPEYKAILEGAISAQYAAASIETITKPNYFKYKHVEILPLEPTKEPVYPIKTFKNLPDDPMNNIIDAIGKVSVYDTVTILMPLKPASENEYNKRAKFLADAVYRKDKQALEETSWRKYLLMPWKIIDFFIHGPSKELIYKNDDGSSGDKMVRMVKAQEDSLNAMGEEAAMPGYHAGILLISSSDNKTQADANIDTIYTAYNIYNDEYCNKFDAPQRRKDLLGFFFKPVRKFAATIGLPYFFYKRSIFGLNSLASLFHIPDGMYNRSPIIAWMEYKMLAPPDNVPQMKQENGFIISGILAEKYKDGKLSDIIESDYQNHRAVGCKDVVDVVKIPREEATQEQRTQAQQDPENKIKEENGKKYILVEKTKKVWGYKGYKDGVLLGVNIYRNRYTPIYFKRDDRTRHHYAIGKSGTGKSVFIQTLARQDIRNGDGVCVIDPHGDLVEDILEYIPKERAKDVIFFDAGNEERPMGLNLYEIDHIDQADRTVNDATEIFLKMFGPEIFGPRIQEYFKYGSLTILEDFEDRPTLLDVPRLFTDETYRDFKTKKVKNPVVRNFWEKTYNAMGDREKQEIIPYFTSKFVSFNTNRLIRNIIGQTKSAIRFREAMDSQKIILVSLSKGKIGEINAQLLGMILVSQIYNAAMGRANIEQSQRKDFYLYVDEFQNFVSGTFADILSEARKYRLSLFMAHQYIAQLEAPKGLGGDAGGKGDVKAAVFGNCGTIMSFKVGAPDAEFLEKEYAPVLSQQDIIGIANYKCYIKLNINNSTSRVFSMNAIYTKDYQNKKIAPILKEYSAKKYGRKREFVDAEIAIRLGLGGENEEDLGENTGQEGQNTEQTNE